jgi:small GTP-binding protein
VEVARLRELLKADDRYDDPVFRHAFAVAEGRVGDAQEALLQIARGGDVHAASALYATALQRCDLPTLRAAIEVLGESASAEARQLLRACVALDASQVSSALEILDGLTQTGVQLQLVAQAIRVRAFGVMLQAGDEGTDAALIEFRKAAATFDRMPLIFEVEELAVERSRPLRVAVVGEFNAGKSTFINALLGADVAPTGVLPTTATLHWLTWAQDPFSRIVLHNGGERIVAHELLKRTLQEIASSGAGLPQQVYICAPIERLRRIELLDTPGFNAPDSGHIDAATRALGHAHLVLWLMDGSQALKDSEREILERISSMGTPIQVLINKLDRLSPSQAQDVVAHVQTGLAASGIESIGPIVVFSAKQALRGRIGDPDLLADSGWGQVEQVLSTYVVGRCDEYRRNAIRRKVARIGRRLLTDLQASAGGESDDGQRRRQAGAERLLQLDQNDYREMASRLENELGQINDDLRPLVVASMPLDDPQAMSYFQGRATARLGVPILRALCETAGLWDETAQWRRELLTVGAVLRGASSALSRWTDARQVASVAVVHACALALAEVLREALPGSALSVERELRRNRLAALCEAIEAGLPIGSASCSFGA